MPKQYFLPLLLGMLMIVSDPIYCLARAPISNDSTFRALQLIENRSAKFLALMAYWSMVKDKRPKLSLEVAKEMMNVSLEQRIDSNIMKSHNSLANSYLILNDYPASLQQYMLMMEIAVRLHDYISQINANLGIGYIYKLTGEIGNNPAEWEKATVFVERALAICKKHGLTEEEPDILNSLAVQYDLRKMPEKAIEIYNEAITAAHKINHKAQEEMLWMNLGIGLKNNGQLDKSLEAYNKAGHLVDSLKLYFAKAFLLDNLANLYYKMDRLEICEKNALAAINMSVELNIDPIREDMYEMLIKLYTKQRRFEEGLLYSNKLSALKNGLFDTERSQQLKELQTKYETDIKDETINNQAVKLAFDKNQNLYQSIGLCLLFIIAVIIFISQLRTKRLYKQITRQREELMKQKQELQNVNAIKDRLFSVIGHDMRAPVNSLISFIMLLENGNVSPEKLSVYTSELKNNLGYTASLMENLLNFAKSQMDGHRIMLENFSLLDVTDDTLMLLLPLAKGKQITIENDIAPTAIISADINMTTLILRNLIGNAIKFSYNGGVINVHTYEQNGKINLVIKDNGKGIEAEVVQSFNNGNTDQQPLNSTPGTQHEKGTGLGLMLCKKFVSLMQGKIWVQSEVGEGSKFVVEFNKDII